MGTLANDEISFLGKDIPVKGRQPTCGLRLRDCGSGRMVLEQFWTADNCHVGDDSLDVWIPIHFEYDAEAHL